MEKKGCQAFLVNVTNVVKETPFKVGDVRVLREFQEVFPDDLLGLPPTLEIDFTTELVIGTELTSKAHTKLKELKK